MNQKVGDWIDVKDLSSNKLSVKQIMHMSPAYPFLRNQASLWDANMKDLRLAREQFDKYLYDRDKQQAYLPRLLVLFIEKSLPHLLLLGASNYFNTCKVWDIYKYEFKLYSS